MCIFSENIVLFSLPSPWKMKKRTSDSLVVSSVGPEILIADKILFKLSKRIFYKYSIEKLDLHDKKVKSQVSWQFSQRYFSFFKLKTLELNSCDTHKGGWYSCGSGGRIQKFQDFRTIESGLTDLEISKFQTDRITAN